MNRGGNPFTNRFGRRPTRGLRPWLLLPKLACVAIFIGAVAAACFVWFTSGWSALDPADPRRLWTVNLIGSVMRFLAVPALTLALAFGVALFLQHPRVFLRLRWLQVKLACLLVAIPASHLYSSSRLASLRAAAEAQVENAEAATQFGRGLFTSLLVFLGVAMLARLKPRLGQNLARTFQAPRTARSNQNLPDDVAGDVG